MKCGAHTHWGSHTEWEVCLWITAVRKFEGVRLIHLFAINCCLDKNTFSANTQIRSVSKSRSHCSISIIIKCLSSRLSFVRLTASLLLLLQICCRLLFPTHNDIDIHRLCWQELESLFREWKCNTFTPLLYLFHLPLGCVCLLVWPYNMFVLEDTHAS